MKSISIVSKLVKYDNPSLVKFFSSVIPYVKKESMWDKVRKKLELPKGNFITFKYL